MGKLAVSSLFQRFAHISLCVISFLPGLAGAMEICNSTSDLAEVAVMYFDSPSSQWLKQGWYQVKANACINLAPTAAPTHKTYFFARSRSMQWAGDEPQSQCIPSSTFTRRADDACDPTSDQTLAFRVGIDPTKGQNRVTLDPFPTATAQKPEAKENELVTNATIKVFTRGKLSFGIGAKNYYLRMPASAIVSDFGTSYTTKTYEYDSTSRELYTRQEFEAKWYAHTTNYYYAEGVNVTAGSDGRLKCLSIYPAGGTLTLPMKFLADSGINPASTEADVLAAYGRPWKVDRKPGKTHLYFRYADDLLVFRFEGIKLSLVQLFADHAAAVDREN